jgi:phosphatidate phosphatase APP1
MYDLLSDFFQLHEFPDGPILLRDWGITENEFFQTRHREYKLEIVRRLLDLFPDLPFILIGDSGQEDPEIYRELVGLYPRRILAVYIRDVRDDDERRMTIGTLADEVAAAGSALILAEQTLSLAQHAAGQGWIPPDALPAIQAEQEAGAAPRSPLETMLDE